MEPFLDPSGLAGAIPPGIREAGANGLAIDADGALVIADSGTRAITRVNLSTRQRTILVDRYDGKRFNSCNDLAIGRDGTVKGAGRRFIDFSDELARKLPGLPDGLKVARTGHVFATGPGGVHVIAPDGRKLGYISTGKPVANCAFGEDGRTLFLTSSDIVARLRLKITAW